MSGKGNPEVNIDEWYKREMREIALVCRQCSDPQYAAIEYSGMSWEKLQKFLEDKEE